MAQGNGGNQGAVKAEEKPDPRVAAKAFREKLTNPANHTKVIFVDASGSEYPARILPVPINKGTVIDVPMVTNYADEAAQIAALPREKQAAAARDLTERMGKFTKALSINGKIEDLAEWNGQLCWTTHNSEGKCVPCADLMIDYTAKDIEGAEPIIKHRSRVKPQEYVSTPAKGTKKSEPYFKLAK